MFSLTQREREREDQVRNALVFSPTTEAFFFLDLFPGHMHLYLFLTDYKSYQASAVTLAFASVFLAMHAQKH